MAVDNIARGMAAEALSGGGGGSSSALSGLTDVDISNPTNGQTLVYNATSRKWENGESAGGGVLVCTLDSQTMTLNHTWQEIKDAALAVFHGGDNIAIAINFVIDNGNYYVWFASFTINESHPVVFMSASATSANDYPVPLAGD